MGSMSVMHWALVAIAVFLLFGKGKITQLMSDLGAGLREGKKALNELDSSKEEISAVVKDAARLSHETKKELSSL